MVISSIFILLEVLLDFSGECSSMKKEEDETDVTANGSMVRARG